MPPAAHRPSSRHVGPVLALLSAVLCLGPSPSASWVQFVDESAARIDADDELGLFDVREKDYAWGDVDRDGDVDLVVVRKKPGTSAGKFRNVLFINENGVLTDRADDFAAASDVPGDQGFLTPTDDRDVALVDVDLDGWLDVVTATTLSQGDPQPIGYPRIYRNLGCAPPCLGTDDWLGFRHESGRIPEMLSWHGFSGHNPNFCAVRAGDVTGDGYPDLWFADYDLDPASSIPSDFNDKLLVNQGPDNPGYFQDVTAVVFSGEVAGIDDAFEVSFFGASGGIADMNGLGQNDVVRQDPGWVGIALNEPTTEGYFEVYGVSYQGSPYHTSVADLNNDAKLDLIVTDDGADRYLINFDNSASGIPSFVQLPFSFLHDGPGGPSSDDGFGSDNLAADLDNDGWNDVLVADVDVDVPGCHTRLHIYRNLGGTPGSAVTLQEQTSGSGCETFFGNPPTCLVASIPSDRLEGTHDVAVFDINGDGWKDLVVGRCSSTEVYINVPSGSPAGAVPDGRGGSGPPLVLGKSLGTSLLMTWGPSCAAGDGDYAVYRGNLGNWTTHAPLTCSTSGSTTLSFTPGVHGEYYLVAPTNGLFEGSHGLLGDGTPRPQGAVTCLAQLFGACE